MKQEDLMIGDVVKYKKDNTVCTIDSHWAIYNAKDFASIHITNDILEKIGFKRYDLLSLKDYKEWVSADGRIRINHLSNTNGKDWSVHVDNERFETVGCCDVECVHELQHLLRLCGIEKGIKL